MALKEHDWLLAGHLASELHVGVDRVKDELQHLVEQGKVVQQTKRNQTRYRYRYQPANTDQADIA